MKIIEKIVAKSNDNLNNPRPRIAFLGDSVTQGALRGGIDLEMVYHNQLKKMIEVLFPGVPVDMINAGIGGTTAGFAVERIDRDIISKKPDLCVVAFGLNDNDVKTEDPLKTFADNLRAIFTKLQENDIEIIFMTENMMNDEIIEAAIEPQYREYADVTCERQNNGWMDTFMEETRKVSAEFGIPVCDCYAKWKKLRENGVRTTRLLINGINHPNQAMHKLFAYSLLETMLNN
ncbi:MAG: GDSL family lipase [Ruminococcaceae bacterium]|nr:GDSL family lipase [Oscillospiraceae bacterium]